jgi:tetratricopeptide (TPR) repeat protein
VKRAVYKRHALFLALALSTFAGAASAKEPTPEEVDRARTFFNAGAQAYAAARYSDAARSFEQANELAPRPQLVFSLAQAERKEFFASNNVAYLRRALQHYKEYLEQVPTGGRRGEATEAKADLEARVARLDPQQAAATQAVEKRRARVTVYSATAGAQISFDGAAPQELPFFSDLEPGKHRVRVFAEGYFDEEREVSGDKAIDQPLDLPLKERPSAVTIVLDAKADVYVDGRIVATAPVSRPIEVPPGPHVIGVAANGKKAFSQEVTLPRGRPFKIEPKLETSGQRLVSYTLLGVGAASIVTGGVLGVLALGQETRAQSVADERAQGNITPDRLNTYNQAISSRDAFRTASIVTLSAGVGCALGGAALYLLDRPSVSVVPPRAVEPTPSLRPLDVAAYPLVGPGTWGGGVTAKF